MVNIRFYLLEKTTEQQADYACRLAQKLLKPAQTIYWYHPDIIQLQQLDNLLWQFQTSSFVPHGIEQYDAAICLSTTLHNIPLGLVFNFSDLAIAEPRAFAQIIEIVDANESSKVLGREKFKHYRSCGIAPKTFKL